MSLAERSVFRINGFVMLAVVLALFFGSLALILTGEEAADRGNLFPIFSGIAGFALTGLLSPGFVALQPNDARVLLFFGRYSGTLRSQGFHWVNPLTIRKKVSLRVRNFQSAHQKVNDHDGNPIEIGAVVVWSVVDPARAVLDVEAYEPFISIQTESALRGLATRFPYDTHDDANVSLRGNSDKIAAYLQQELEEKLQLVGVHIHDARITHLAYAPEIAQVMLRRQQAQAVIAARRQIVEGAVTMVQMALDRLAEHNVVTLDEERKANMVSNLMVVLVSDSQTQPVINAGTLY